MVLQNCKKNTFRPALHINGLDFHTLNAGNYYTDTLVNSECQDEMPPNVVFHHGNINEMFFFEHLKQIYKQRKVRGGGGGGGGGGLCLNPLSTY